MNKLTGILILLFTFICIYISIKANKYPERLIWSDMEGYYVYLPAIILNAGFDNMQVRDTAYLKSWPGTNKVYTKYTYGVALLEAPFFLIAHLLSQPLGYSSDGYSIIYSYALMAAGIFYLILGLFFLWHVLRTAYSSFITATVLAGLLFGTNLYYYSFFQPSMSHVYSFSLFAVLLWLTQKILTTKETGKIRSNWLWVFFGIVTGLIILIRPTNIIVLLYPAYRFWKEGYFGQIKSTAVLKILLAVFIPVVIIWLPQIAYWKSVTGDYFKWSYGEESFKYWQEPKLIRVLIDPWNGWILHSPIVILPILGLFNKNTYNNHYNKIVGYILILATYIFASWWAWWFGGAFGARSYVEFYALLAIPFAQVASNAFKNKILTILFVVMYLLLIQYNLGLTYLYAPPWDGPSWTYESLFNEIKKIF